MFPMYAAFLLLLAVLLWCFAGTIARVWLKRSGVEEDERSGESMSSGEVNRKFLNLSIAVLALFLFTSGVASLLSVLLLPQIDFYPMRMANLGSSMWSIFLGGCLFIFSRNVSGVLYG
jgi:hypothetical protein